MNTKTIINLFKKIYVFLQDYLTLPSIEKLKNIDWSNIQSILTTLGLTIILIIILLFILWLIKSIGLYKMAKRKEDKLAFLAFIPYGCLFVIGRIVEKTNLFGIEIAYPELILPLLIITMFFPVTYLFSSLLYIIFYYGLLYKLFKLKWKGFAFVATIISIFVPIFQPLFIFCLRNK